MYSEQGYRELTVAQDQARKTALVRYKFYPADIPDPIAAAQR